MIGSKVKYSSFACPPRNDIGLETVYEVCEDEKGTFIQSGGKKIYLSLDVIKMLFSPITSTQNVKNVTNKKKK